MRLRNLRRIGRSGPYLLILLSLQFSWTFYCGIVFDYLGEDHNNVESRLTQIERELLPIEDNQERIVSQEGSFGIDNPSQGSDNPTSRAGSPQTGGTRKSSGKIGIMNGDPPGSIIEDYVDNQNSDMDSLGDFGILTDFSNLQAPDSTYANFSEVNPGGSDFTVSSSNTIINNYTFFDRDEPASETAIAVNDGSDFKEGDTVLIIQMQNGTGSGTAGQFEFNTIASVAGNTINLETGLANAYYSGTFDAAANSEVTQVVQVPIYRSVTVQASASITCPAWDGYTGGIIAFNATTFVTVTGSIDADGNGFRGGLGITSSSAPEFAYAGESWNGKGGDSTDESPNNGGGGGGDNDLVGTGECGASGGGGGYGTAGSDGLDSQEGQPAGHGGNAYGLVNLDTLFLGSGGGGGGSDNDGLETGTDGGTGGGIVIISATTSITVAGTISANGEDGTTAVDWAGAGGGGSGGSIWLRASTLTLGTNLVTAIGGTGGVQGQGNNGGNGGNGRIRLDNTTLSGSTNPTPGYYGNPIIAVVGEGFYHFEHEVQFTSVAHFLDMEKLCIETGSFGGSEDLNVTVWNGSAWRPIFSDLTASSWNNVTVAVNTTTFTIKFGGSMTSSDSTQDWWEIDAVLLQLDGPGINETYVMNDDSNVDSAEDHGDLQNFDNMKDTDASYAILNETALTSNNNSLNCSGGSPGGYMVLGSGTLDWSGANGTISWWMKFDSVGSGRPYGQNGDMELRWSGGSSLALDWGGVSMTTAKTFAANEWYFMAVVWDENDNDLFFYWGTETVEPTLDANSLAGTWSGSTPAATNSYFMRGVGGTDTVDGQGDDLRYWNIKRTRAQLARDYKEELTGSESGLQNYYQLDDDFTDSAGTDDSYGTGECSFTDSDIPSFSMDSKLDQEVQWVDIPYQLPYEYLCIYTSSTDEESLEVDVWNGSDWENLIPDLSTNSWNNVSVHRFLNSTTFTIRFSDGTKLSDTNQDYWEIDAVILSIWNPIPTNLAAWSYPNATVVDTVYYHPNQNHSFFIQWNDTLHDAPINAISVEINSSKVMQVANGTLGGHSFEFLPNTTGIDPLNKIQITLFQQRY
ncbi:MAG: hypothetical protein ACXAB4_04420, partial [Candidatus Hodarchaeales archaeon]